MYRVIRGKVYGVLTDYDLTSWATSLTEDYTPTSQQRTGTPPFMAIGMLNGMDTLHLYRHDLELLFYIMVILATHYEIEGPRKGGGGGVRMRGGKLPFERWFDEPSYEDLASFKKFFISECKDLDLSPTFEDFRDWLLDLRASFASNGACTASYRLSSATENTVVLNPIEGLGHSASYHHPASSDRTLAGKFASGRPAGRYESQSAEGLSGGVKRTSGATPRKTNSKVGRKQRPLHQ